MFALALALSSSLCWGLSDFIGGVQARRVSLLRVLFISQAVGFCCLAVVLAVVAPTPPALAKLLPAAAGGLGGLAALAAFYRGLAIGTMSIVAPVSSTGVAVPVLVGILGGERPKALQLAGIALALLGVVLASREQAGSAAAGRAARLSLGLALVAALGFGGFFVGMRISARHGVLWALLAARVADVIPLGAAVLAGGLGPRDGTRARMLLPLVAVGLLDLLATGLYAFATRHGLLSVVAVAASLYPLTTVLLARGMLGERVRRVQELGILAALAGVALIAAG